jgi:hypothetical protein
MLERVQIMDSNSNRQSNNDSLKRVEWFIAFRVVGGF